MSALTESKMDDKEVLKAAKSLAKNGKDEKTKSFGQGLVDYYKENDSFTPNQVSGLQNIMKNASFQMAKEDTDVSAEDFINHVEREDFVEAKEIFNTLIHQKAYEHIKSSEAEIAAKMFESVSRQSDLDSDKPVIVKGVKGMKSKPFTKKFKNQQAADKWIDDNEDDIDVTQIMNEDLGKDRLPMNEVKEEGTITVKELEPGKSYTFYDEMGTSFKATVKSIRRSGANKVVKYTYDDNSYGNKGQTDEFEVSDDEKVFMEDIGSREKRDFKRREMETELGIERTLHEAKSVGAHVWKSAMDNPFAVTATVGRVSGERVKSFDNLEDAIKVADNHKDGKVTHNVSGKVLYKDGKKTRDARMYEETLT